ncbi:MAG: hypothetical protein WC225_02775 [Acholeplasmataceae bacterium]
MNFDNNDEKNVEELKQEKVDELSVDTTIDDEGKKKIGLLGGIKKIASKGVDLAKSGIEKGIDVTKEGVSKVKDKYEQVKLSKEELKKYENTYRDKTYLFEIKGTINNKGSLETIRAFRDMEKQMLYIPQSESNLNIVKSKTNLINTSDASVIEVEYIETKDISLREMFSDDNTKFDVQCYQAKFNFLKSQAQPTVTNISNVVNQNVNVSGQHTGDINLTSNIEQKLDTFINDVKGFKTKLFSKERKAQDEAIKIIGPVKDSIINGKKDPTLLQRFLDLLVGFAPALAETFKTFM